MINTSRHLIAFFSFKCVEKISFVRNGKVSSDKMKIVLQYYDHNMSRLKSGDTKTIHNISYGKVKMYYNTCNNVERKKNCKAKPIIYDKESSYFHSKYSTILQNRKKQYRFVM